MSAWDDGYVSDLTYTYGYYNELNPLRARFALLCNGFIPPEINRSCELGFGQGISINMHAAATGVEWFGNDFNPTQALFARDMGYASGAKVNIFDDSFEEFSKRHDLPEFDFIGLHGIWSWISNENRQNIIQLIKKKLRLGGIVYISYNILPGWATNAPLRHLMTEHNRVFGNQGLHRRENVDAALQFIEKLFETKPSVLKNAPGMAERYKQISSQNRNYLAHEYFNRDWEPVYFREMAECMDQAKLSYASSANFLDFIDNINLTADQRKLLGDIKDPVMREGIRDFLTNNQFRRDYWIKGGIRYGSNEALSRLANVRFVLGLLRENAPGAINTSLGEAKLSGDVYPALYDLMSDYKVRSFMEIMTALGNKGINAAAVREALIILVGVGTIMIAQDDATIESAMATTRGLNRSVLAMSGQTTNVGYLASPVTGGGMMVRRFHQIFMSVIQDGATADSLAAAAWAILKKNGERLAKDGKPIADDAGNMAELAVHAGEFRDKWLPLYRSLQLV